MELLEQLFHLPFPEPGEEVQELLMFSPLLLLLPSLSPRARCCDSAVPPLLLLPVIRRSKVNLLTFLQLALFLANCNCSNFIFTAIL